MTDFLTRLAERTLGLTPRVQPLLASRYAPGPAAPVVPDMLDEEHEATLTRPADPTPAPRSRDGALSTSESVLPRAVSKTHNASTTTGLAAATAENAAAPAAESLRGRPRRPVREASLASPERRGQAASAHPWLAPNAPDAMVQANQSGQHHEVPHAAALLPSPVPQVPWEATNGGRSVFDRPDGERAACRADAVRSRLASFAGHGEPLPSANESGPPVIRVSIGRIEVRAILPPAPAAERPVPASASPALSLDQYLKQRQEVQR